MNDNRLKIGLLRQIEAAYSQINKFSGGILDLPKLAVKRYFESGANEAVASIAFYVVFSLRAIEYSPAGF